MIGNGLIRQSIKLPSSDIGLKLSIPALPFGFQEPFTKLRAFFVAQLGDLTLN